MSTRFSNEEGFGMVEVLVAMLLLGVAAIMALPMLHMSLENSRLTTNAAEASQLMNSEISHVSSREHTCQGLAQWAAAPPESPRITSHGVELVAERQIGACSTPGTAKVTVRVTGGGRAFGDVSTVVRIGDEDSSG
ncbi:type II secretion system protein [Nesterenkonia sp. NBAIMH1]|uniref:type II secretion system protein n=1 Tax=Nesterenkonia sp. NBAIMH1 TaxID=2600320 RepID=UPI00143D3FBA|nr:prepilin-type N-terminal cleavage/methylation domain-containing protein [Nesterenkonia sp. NBAIMH1]